MKKIAHYIAQRKDQIKALAEAHIKVLTTEKLIMLTVAGVIVVTAISGKFAANIKFVDSIETEPTIMAGQQVLESNENNENGEAVGKQEEMPLPSFLERPGNELILNRKRELASLSITDRSAISYEETIKRKEFPVQTEIIKETEEGTEKSGGTGFDKLVKSTPDSKFTPSSKSASGSVGGGKSNATPKGTVDNSKVSSQQNNYDTSLNSYVLDVIKTYKLASNNYPYLLNTDYANYNGVTENLVYQGKVLLKAHPSGKRYSHCTGITFEVFFKAMQERNKKLGLSPDDFNGMTFDELFDFVMSWYVADGNKAVQNVAKAVEKYGIGRRITNWEEARAGDFIDLSRENNTGHTVVFINWLRDKNGKIIGLNYWSSQESTGGISYKEEYFNIPNAKGQKYGNVMSDYLFIARILPVRDYR